MAPSICIEQVNQNFCWLTKAGVFMCRSRQGNIACKFVLASTSSAHHVPFIFLLGWLEWWEVSGCAAAVLLGAVSRICSKQHSASLWISYLAFLLSILLESKWHSRSVVQTAWKDSFNVLWKVGSLFSRNFAKLYLFFSETCW